MSSDRLGSVPNYNQSINDPTRDLLSSSNKRVKPDPESSLRTSSQANSSGGKNSSPKSKLIPRSVRKRASLGQRDDTLLRVLCDDSETGHVKELHFRKISHSLIDWDNPKHIADINAWRNQIYGRAGLKSKEVTVWCEEEELWFELYYHLSIAESRARGLLLPKIKMISDAFNATFAGHTFGDQDGNEVEPRATRQVNAFGAKFKRMCPRLRSRLHQCVFGKSGDVFVPEITLDMLGRYREMKLQMSDMGVVEESAYSDDLGEWQSFFFNLSSIGKAGL